jgi:hypothetical protein
MIESDPGVAEVHQLPDRVVGGVLVDDHPRDPGPLRMAV